MMAGTNDLIGDGIPGGEDVMDNAGMIDLEAEADIRNSLVTEAYGTKIAQRRAGDET
jgi:hypothetical protein